MKDDFKENVVHIEPKTPDENPPAPPASEEAPPPIATINAASLAGKPVPSRKFLDSAGLVPMKNITLLYGDGGTGKSLLALQLGFGVSLTGKWLGMNVDRGTALYFSAEDDEAEMHRRLVDIATAEGLDLYGLGGLELMDMVGGQTILAIDNGRGVIVPTDLFKRLDATAAQIKPIALFIDNLADAYAGNENDKVQVRQFMNMLRGLAVKHNCAIIVLAHPSQSGMISGTGTSGNTAWNNSARARLYFRRIKSADDTEENPDRRILEMMKANYGPTGGQILLEWTKGYYATVENTVAGPLDATAKAMKAERVFKDLLRWHVQHELNVSPNRSASYAPKLFSEHADSEGVTKREFERAMQALLTKNEIEVGQAGRPSRPVASLIFTTEPAT